MGGIVSTPLSQFQDDGSLVNFSSEQLMEGQDMMRGDDDLIRSFIGFLKGGTWVGKFAAYTATTYRRDDEVYADGEWRHIYSIREDNFPTYLSEMKLELSGSAQTQPSRTPNSPNDSKFDESYMTASRCDCFDRTEFACILIFLTYPIFMEARRNKPIPQSFSQFWHRSQTVGSFASGPPNPGLVQTAQSLRAQDLLLGCAAYFDADHLMGIARQGWLDVVSRAVMEHPLAISIVDTTKPFAPFEYANRAFGTLFGYARDALQGASMSVLRGKGTEDRQCQLLQKALHGTEPTKLWITHYTRSGQRVLDLVAVAPLGDLTICVHFGAKRGADFHKLRQVDDLLLLLGHLVRPPGRTASVHHALESLRVEHSVQQDNASLLVSDSTAACMANVIASERALACPSGPTSPVITAAATTITSASAHCSNKYTSPCSSEKGSSASGSSRAGGSARGSARGSGKGVDSVKVNGRVVRFQPSAHAHSGNERRSESATESPLTVVGEVEDSDEATELD